MVVAGLDELDPLPSAPQSLVLDEPAAQGIARLADTMPTTAPEVEVIEDDDCIILYTSGTTGRPKERCSTITACCGWGTRFPHSV